MSKRVEAIIALFFVSGFAGLIYESVWSHYVKLFLGHAAYAQTLVLVVFIGGLALGSWLCARRARMGNPLRLYAIVEGAIGIIALVFHPIFLAATEWGYDTLLPATCSAGSSFCAAQWGLSALLLAPQSVLLGMTFPLVSSAVLRTDPMQPGHHISTLYFVNSMGAVLGVLSSAFLLVPAVGLPGTLATAGAMNLAIAVVAFMLSRENPAPLRPMAAPAGEASMGSESRLVTVMLVVACLTGLSSFIYEISWIRMLSLVLGASTYSFELMLASFIMGLAAGGWWIRSRIDRLGDPIRFLARVQVLMGIAAVATVPLYSGSFDLMAWILGALSRNDGGFVLFSAASTFIALAVMLPATICAGMTLPLITYRLLRSREGERSLGLVYAANTLGSIIGVIIAVHLLLRPLGLHGTLVAGAAIDVALGVWLYCGARGRASIQAGLKPALAGVVAFVLISAFFDVDMRRSSSGVFRTGAARIAPDTVVAFHKDGKTATVDVLEDAVARSIRTNGKPDASIAVNPKAPPSKDEATMLLLGALPLGHRPDAKTAAVIGFGSGMSTSVLLGSPNLQRVDTVEIEPAMVEGAALFRPVVEAAYTDPRSHIVIDDAKSYFARGGARYDIIVSEPSNPWVSGVSSLFSEEFYARLSHSLNDGGVLCQWLHTYEMDDFTIGTIFEAVAKTFPNFIVYTSIDADVILIARKGGPVGRFDESVLQWPGIKPLSSRLGFDKPGMVLRRPMGTSRAVLGLFRGGKVNQANSDFFPIVDQRASKTRFTRAQVMSLAELQGSSLPLLEMLDGSFRPSEHPVLDGMNADTDYAAYEGWLVHDLLLGQPRPPAPLVRLGSSLLDARVVDAWASTCPPSYRFEEVLPSLSGVATSVNARLARGPATEVWTHITKSPCMKTVSPAGREWIDLFTAVAQRDPEAMARHGRGVLDSARGVKNALTEYAFVAAVAGNICLGRRAETQNLLADGPNYWIRAEGHSAELRYLYAMSQDGAIPPSCAARSP
ncbi:MAG TPA: fused MFS/spermidine synthase [Burkholderiales bacterium]|nr:fused MFS/spermidine synthase [Burkholderiales bacterium]